MEIFFSLAIAYIGVAWVGYRLGEFVTLLRVQRLIEKLAISGHIDVEAIVAQANAEKNGITNEDIKVFRKLQTETHHDILYLFDAESGDFVCQGNTIEELAKFAKEHKRIVDAVVEHGDRKFIFQNGESKEFTYS